MRRVEDTQVLKVGGMEMDIGRLHRREFDRYMGAGKEGIIRNIDQESKKIPHTEYEKRHTATNSKHIIRIRD